MICPGQSFQLHLLPTSHHSPSAKQSPHCAQTHQAPFCLSGSLCPPEPQQVGSFSSASSPPPPQALCHQPVCSLVSGPPVQCLSPQPNRHRRDYQPHSPLHSQFATGAQSGCPAYTGLVNVPEAHLVLEDQGHHATNRLNYEPSRMCMNCKTKFSESLRGEGKCHLLQGQAQ